MRLLTVGGLLAYRALFNWATPVMFIGTLLVGPLFQLLFFAYLGRQLGVADDGFYIVGNSVLAASVLCMFGGSMAVLNERRFGTLGHVLLSPRSRTVTWIGRALPYAGNGLLVAAFTLTVGTLLLGLRVPAGGWPGLVLALASAALACAAFGLVLGAFALRFRDAWMINNTAVTLMILFSGTNVPRSVLPGWMQAVGDVTPVTHAAAASRALVGGASLTEVLPRIGAELGIGLGYAVLAGVLLKLFEAESRRRASLDTL
ncbi:ABC transporter permease [Luedemannella helvata]|uniref:ABC-2 type transporter transmembrane domain-containing protein n=1 Tax=Luedemannella helvata TaxID=349315 RepID=A0ABP4WXG6_9ACTN